MNRPDTPPKLLLVDDAPHTLFAMRDALRKTGAEILEATSGTAALRLALVHDFALILLDVHMPGMDGYETARLLHGTEQTRHTPILFITGGECSEHDSIKGYMAGGVDYLRKPVSVELLVAKVATFLELYRRRREEKKNLLLLHELSRQQNDTERLHELAVYLQQIREDERKQMAHEVHDELGSRLAKIKMEMILMSRDQQDPHAVADWMGRLLPQIDGLIESVRRVAVSLRPHVLDEMGLFSALEWLARDFSRHERTMQVTLTPDSQNLSMEEPVKTALFRISQEALVLPQMKSDSCLRLISYIQWLSNGGT
ncbi:MAG: response regulator, partial [Magnetococcales bacterium]|nr:response regulator [Magnetococcales bacterium]MBF0116725.1 response regulator [Magnetococcales bacterium]